MNATQNIPVSDTGHPLCYETNRRIASQARSEFLGEGLAYIYQSIRNALRHLAHFALKKGVGAMQSTPGTPFKKA